MKLSGDRAFAYRVNDQTVINMLSKDMQC